MFGKDYNDIDVSVHGGLTFGEIEPCAEHEDGQGYWFGFDCAHAGDASYDPDVDIDTLSVDTQARLLIHRRYPAREHYWTQGEVERETELLAEQMAALGTAA
jgi:hypothetical protein